MGAIAVTGLRVTVMGNRRIATGTWTGSSSYATGGDTLTKAQLGMNALVQFAAFEVTAGERIAEYDYTSEKLKLIEPTQQTAGTGNRQGAEVANATDVSATTGRFFAVGV